MKSLVTAVCSLTMVTAVIPTTQAWAAVDKAALIAEAAKFGLTITFGPPPPDICDGATACWKGPGRIAIDLNQAQKYSNGKYDGWVTWVPGFG